MADASSSLPVWQVITHLGSSSLLLPALALVLGGLWEAGLRSIARRYVLHLALAVALTIFTKCLFFGWGIGIAALDFTGISGHTLLATTILPLVLRGIPWPALQRGGWLPALSAGLVLAVGVSRVVLGAHSVSEVVAGWVLGAAVVLPTLRALQAPAADGQPRLLPHWASKVAPLVLLLALHSTSATYLPTHSLEVRLALLVSGQGKPFARHHLHRPAAPAPVQPSTSATP